MGWTPQQVWESTLAGFGAAFEGWKMANVPEDPTEPDFSAEAMDRLDAIAQREQVRAWRRSAAAGVKHG